MIQPETKSQIRNLCDCGYASHDATHYGEIAKLVEGTEGEEAEKVRRLCEAGPTLSSKRFAYPHIKSAIDD